MTNCADQISQEISRMLSSYSFFEADSLVDELCSVLEEAQNADYVLNSGGRVGSLVGQLNKHRRYEKSKKLGKTYLQISDNQDINTRIRMKMAQIYLDEKDFEKAENTLKFVRDKVSANEFMLCEVIGLLGRLNKQRYIDSDGDSDLYRINYLDQALSRYWSAYKNNKEKNFWPGINVVACMARAEKDGEIKSLKFSAVDDWKSLAKEIYSGIDRAFVDPAQPDYTWAAATAMEAAIALNEHSAIGKWLENYLTSPFADKFELGSTYRQLKELWGLDEPESNLSGEGNSEGARAAFHAIQGRIGALGGILEVPVKLGSSSKWAKQANYGSESTVSVYWMENAVERAKSVVNVRKRGSGVSVGTGFLVTGRELLGQKCSGEFEKRIYMVTCDHVVGESDNFLHYENAEMVLTKGTQREPINLTKPKWRNPAKELDVAIYAIGKTVDDPGWEKTGIPIASSSDVHVPKDSEESRLFVLGHPFTSHEMQITMYDNKVVDYDVSSGKISYRCPTENGSSGSPVMTNTLTVVAIHSETDRVNQVNRGTAMDVVRSKSRRKLQGDQE